MPRLRYFSWRREWRTGALVAAVLTAVYAATMPPGVTFEDTGLIAAVCSDFGFLHPPGYPLYALLCAPFARLADFTALNPAQATALFSALAAAGACVLFYEIARRFGARKAVAAAAALTLGLGARFWAQAIIPEVYALNALLTAATFALVLRIVRAPRRARWLALFLLGGLGLANHWPLYLSVAPSFALFLAGARRFPDGKTAAAGAAMLAAGLSLYLYLLLRPQWGEMISDFAPPHDWETLYAYMTRAIYVKENELWIRNGMHCVQSALWSARLLATEYTVLGGFAALCGAAVFFRRRPLLWSLAVLWGAMSAPLLAGYLCNDLRGDTVKTVLAAYSPPAMLFVMLWIVAAISALRAPKNILAAAVLAAATGAANWAENDRREDRFAEEYATAVLDSLPPDSAFVVADDWSFPMLYLHRAEGRRSDVRFFRDLPDAAANAAGRRIFGVFPDFSGEFVNDWGIVRELPSPETADAAPIPPPLIRFYQSLPARRTAFDGDNRQWDKAAMQRALLAAGRVFAIRAAAGELSVEAAAAQNAVLQTPEGLFGKMETSLRLGAPVSVLRDMLAPLAEQWRSFPHPWRGRLRHREGIVHLFSRQPWAAEEKWRESLTLNTSVENPALIDLLHLLALEQRWREYALLRKRYAVVKNPALDKTDALCAAAGECEPAR